MQVQRRYQSNEIDLAIERFDESWQAGVIPDINNFLSGQSESIALRRGELLVELVMIDMEYRWRGNHAEEGTSGFARRPRGGRLYCCLSGTEFVP